MHLFQGDDSLSAITFDSDFETVSTGRGDSPRVSVPSVCSLPDAGGPRILVPRAASGGEVAVC